MEMVYSMWFKHAPSRKLNSNISNSISNICIWIIYHLKLLFPAWIGINVLYMALEKNEMLDKKISFQFLCPSCHQI